MVWRFRRWFALKKYQAIATQERIETIANKCYVTDDDIPIKELDELSELIAIFADYDYWNNRLLGDCLGVGIRYRDSDFIRRMGNEFYQPRIYEDDQEFVDKYNAYHARRHPPALRIVD